MGEQFSLLWFFGSLAIFFYGIRLSRNGLQRWFGDQLKPLLTTYTNNRFKALFVGAFITLVFQSSSATTIALVSFAGAGLMTLTQAMGAVLGADIGTTLVVILFSVKSISDYGLLLLIIGVILELYTKKKRGHYISMVLCGLGFVFFGLKLLNHSTHTLSEDHVFLVAFEFIKNKALLMFIVAAVITPFVSSAGVLGLAIGLSFSGILNLSAAMPIILGANVGSALTPLLASLSERNEGKRVAIAHLIFKSAGALLVVPTMAWAQWFITEVSQYLGHNDAANTQIAIAHLCFNLGISVLFLPFINVVATLVKKILPDAKEDEAAKFGSRYLNNDHLSQPLLAFANVRRELLRLADITCKIYQECMNAFKRPDPDLISTMEANRDLAVAIDKDIRIYVTHITQDQLTGDQSQQSLSIIDISAAFRDICDMVVQNLLDYSEKKIRSGVKFSEEGWTELNDYHQQVLSLLEMSVSVLTTNEEEYAHKLLHKAEHLRLSETTLRQNHLERLKSGLEEAAATSSLHLGILTAFGRVVKDIEEIMKQVAWSR